MSNKQDLQEKKKELIIATLERLVWTWDQAEDLILLIKKVDASDKLIDWLTETIEATIENIKDSKQKEIMQKALSSLKEMQRLEAEEKAEEELEAENTLNNLL